MILRNLTDWWANKPSQKDATTQKIDKILEEIKVESSKMSQSVNALQKSDLLRSLVISMNRGR